MSQISDGTRLVVTLGESNPDVRECVAVGGLFQHVLNTAWAVEPSDRRITGTRIIQVTENLVDCPIAVNDRGLSNVAVKA
jgi:hypothetical protein